MISKIVPQYLSYPKLLTLNDIPEIYNQFVYVIEGYQDKGFGALIYRSDDNVYIKFGDFDGKIIDMSKTQPKGVQIFVSKYFPKIINLMKTARIQQSIYYFTVAKDDICLVDMRTSLNKFSGPGMLRDLFAKIIPIQKVIKTATLNQDMLNSIKAGTGSYAGNLILKTSSFKTIIRNENNKQNMYPMYAVIKR
jgi:hypothetical protein